MVGANLPLNRNRIDQRIILFHTAAQEFTQRSGLAEGLQAIVIILHSRALAEHQMSPLPDVLDEVFGYRIRNYVEPRRHNQFELGQRSGWRDDVEGLTDNPQRPVIADELINGIVIAVVALPIDGPTAVIRVKKADFGFNRGTRKCRTGF